MSKIQGSSEVRSIVEEYMVSQNRPHNSTNVFTNLHGKVPKTQVVKVLDELTKAGVLVEKLYGKQKLHCASQDQFGVIDPAEVADVDTKIKSTAARLAEVKGEVASHQAVLKSLQSEPTDSEATSELGALKEANKKRGDKLASLRSSGNQISEVEKKKINKDYDTNVTHWRKRKRMLRNITDAVMENYPKNKKALYDDMGVEDDKAAGVDFENF